MPPTVSQHTMPRHAGIEEGAGIPGILNCTRSGRWQKVIPVGSKEASVCHRDEKGRGGETGNGTKHGGTSP